MDTSKLLTTSGWSSWVLMGDPNIPVPRPLQELAARIDQAVFSAKMEMAIGGIDPAKPPAQVTP